MLLDDLDIEAVVAATGLQASTVEHIARRLEEPVPGDPSFTGNGMLRCRLCGRPYREHRIGRCPASA
jgi:hypothetical protein